MSLKDQILLALLAVVGFFGRKFLNDMKGITKRENRRFVLRMASDFDAAADNPAEVKRLAQLLRETA